MSKLVKKDTEITIIRSLHDRLRRLELALQQVSTGGGGDVDVHEYTQVGAANPWIITHGLSRLPAGIVVLDTSDNEVMADVQVTETEITISFGGAMAGKVLYV